MTRRECLGAMIAAGGGLLAACHPDGTVGSEISFTKLTARPGTPLQASSGGMLTFPAAGSTAIAWVPTAIRAAEPVPLLVFLHGAFHDPQPYINLQQAAADAAHAILLAPYATAASWDALNGGFGPDIGIINAALDYVFKRWTIRADRIACTGFSDGASYALAVGRANGDLFSRVAAWSPGVLLPVGATGRPPILITHGTQDQVLDIDACSRVIVPQLRALAYDVDYREFDGPHTVVPAVLTELITSLAAP